MKKKYPQSMIFFGVQWSVVAMAGAALLLTVGASGVGAQERFDWMPPEAVDANATPQDFGGPQVIPEITITQTPKPTADESRYTNVYTLDLEAFSISNDGTNPVETAKGINAALQHAKTVGANRIVFPEGTYLISENDPIIIDHENTIIDLNGATLQINPNGLQNYTLVIIVDGTDTVRLTNGTLRGDKDVHDFSTVEGTHEWGAGLRFSGGRNLEVDHLTLANFTGDGAVSSIGNGLTRDELLQKIMHRVYVSHLEQGGFSEEGEKIDDPDRIRSIERYDLTRMKGRSFEFGHPFDYLGYPSIKGRVYQVYFYDKDRKFLEKQVCLQYRKVTPPEAAESMHLEFNQPSATSVNPEGSCGRITVFTPSTDVHFHDNVVTGNRRLGLAYCGGQKWLIENNRFEFTGGTAPGYGIDLEDGWELMQDVVIRNNSFKGNQAGDLVICAGSELIIDGNEFESNVIMWGRPHNYVFRNNRYTGGRVSYKTRTGVASIHDNHYENCSLSIEFDTKGVADGLVRLPGQNVVTPPLVLENETLVNVSRVSGTYFNFINPQLKDVRFVAGQETRMISLQGATAEGVSIDYREEGPQVEVKIDATSGTVEETGPGLARRQSSAQTAGQ